jgi:pseudaminic acid biosynthesis-associated methylase
MATKDDTEAPRLEGLWSGEFGDAYTDRNVAAGEARGEFWRALHQRHGFERVLEVGCNVGANLRWLAELCPPRDVFGVDVNEGALARGRARLPALNFVWAPARELPFRDRFFDLAFTVGVLIHQPDESLETAMQELVRCSRRLVLSVEYYEAQPVEVPYRGQTGALFRRDYGGIFRRACPELRLLEEGSFGQTPGWENLTWWLFERS